MTWRRELLALTLVAAGSAWWFWRRPPAPPTLPDRRHSAIWMAHKWIGKSPSTEEVRAAAGQLATLGFTDLYFHCGPLDAQGKIPDWDPAAWARVLADFRAAIPGLRAFAWVGGVTVQGYGVAPDTVDDSKPEVRAAVVARCQDLLEKGGFDGIHYDLEPVPSGDEGFVQLLEQTRVAIAPKPLSVAGWCMWRPLYLQEVAHHCDQVAIMGYDLGAPTPAQYEQYLAMVVPNVAQILEGTRCVAVLGVPAYSGESTPSHHPAVENPWYSLAGIKQGLLATKSFEHIQGVGLYAQWTARADDWYAFRREWQP